MIARRVIVISLARRPDRRRAITRAWPLPQIRLRFFDAIDDQADANRGCMASHIAALAAAPDKPTLMLEDDAVFAPGFTLDLHPPDDWDLLWLGGQHLMPPNLPQDGWAVPRHIIRTHGYLVRRPRQLARHLRESQLPHTTMFALPLTQYAQVPFTIGQAAGRSDIQHRRTRGGYFND